MRLALDAQTDQARRLLERLAPEIGDDLARELLDGRPGHRGRDRRPARAGRPAARGARADRGSRGPGRPAPAGPGRRPRPPGRLDHRRRRLGVRHRLRRPRPGPVVGPQRQHPRPRHRGLLEHRRPVLEGDAARRRGQVRGGRQGHRQEGPRRDRALVRQRLRRPDLDGRQRSADHQGAARSRCLAGSVAGDRLQHLHRPRHRHVEVDDPPEGRGQERLLAAVPLPPVRGRGRQAVQARLDDAVDPDRRLRRRPRRASPSCSERIRNGRPSSRTLAQADADERWRYYEQLAGIERTVPHRPSTRSRDRARGRERRRLPVRERRRPAHDRRPRDPLPRAGAPLADRRFGRAAQRGPGHGPSLERAGVGAIVLPSLFEEEILAEEIELDRSLEQGTEHFAEALDYFPRRPARSQAPPTATWPPWRESRPRSRSPSSQA